MLRRLLPLLCRGAMLVAIALPAFAQTYRELISFNGDTAAGPVTPLTQGTDGDLYGTTEFGGNPACTGYAIGCGIVFKITRKGEFQVLYNFPPDGGADEPINDLVLGRDGNLYGTTADTVFKITPAGGFTTLHTFTNGVGGYDLGGGVVQGLDGDFYGTTSAGGQPSNSCSSGCGTVFKMTPSGEVTTLYSFCPQNYCPDGEDPIGPLTQGPDGNFYGTAYGGGLYKSGTFFKITSSGAFKLLYTFPAGTYLMGGTILATDGNFYGANAEGGLYRMTPEGDYIALPNPGNVPNVPLQGSDGNLYGTTQAGNGGHGFGPLGNIFEMPLSGSTYNSLYFFEGYPNDGSYPFVGLVQATNGIFYGTTYTGGGSPCNYYVPGCGTVYSIDMGLGPFVAFINRAGRVGQEIGILGQGFLGTSGVSVNGTPANFTVRSETLLIATIPAGATTGYVTVTTPTGILTSNVPFRVIQ